MSPAAKDALVVLGTFALLGVVCGLLWWLLVEPATYTKVLEGGTMSEVELGKRFNGDGWYAVVAVVAGLLAGGLVTRWRSRDFLLTTALLVLGAGVAGAVVAAAGHLLGPGDPDAALAGAQVGEKVPMPLRVTAPATYLAWPIATLVGALAVLWSKPGGEHSDQPTDEPTDEPADQPADRSGDSPAEFGPAPGR